MTTVIGEHTRAQLSVQQPLDLSTAMGQNAHMIAVCGLERKDFTIIPPDQVHRRFRIQKSKAFLGRKKGHSPYSANAFLDTGAGGGAVKEIVPSGGEAVKIVPSGGESEREGKISQAGMKPAEKYLPDTEVMTISGPCKDGDYCIGNDECEPQDAWAISPHQLWRIEEYPDWVYDRNGECIAAVQSADSAPSNFHERVTPVMGLEMKTMGTKPMDLGTKPMDLQLAATPVSGPAGNTRSQSRASSATAQYRIWDRGRGSRNESPFIAYRQCNEDIRYIQRTHAAQHKSHMNQTALPDARYCIGYVC